MADTPRSSVVKSSKSKDSGAVPAATSTQPAASSTVREETRHTTRNTEESHDREDTRTVPRRRLSSPDRVQTEVRSNRSRSPHPSTSRVSPAVSRDSRRSETPATQSSVGRPSSRGTAAVQERVDQARRWRRNVSESRSVSAEHEYRRYENRGRPAFRGRHIPDIHERRQHYRDLNFNIHGRTSERGRAPYRRAYEPQSRQETPHYTEAEVQRIVRLELERQRGEVAEEKKEERKEERREDRR